MKNAITAILFVIAMICLGCNSSDKKTIASNIIETTKQNDVKKPLTFIDSVVAKMELTHQQMKHTLVDTAIFRSRLGNTSRIPGFTGDTVYFINSKQPLAIINYSDASNCTDKFLLVFKGLKNTACKQVESNCDEDESSDYSVSNFKIINDSTFYTKDVYINRSQKKQKVTVTQKFFKIPAIGKIKMISSKVISKKIMDKAEFIDDESYH